VRASARTAIDPVCRLAVRGVRMEMLRDEALVYHSYDISQSERQF
jgi:hypothetical protein